MKLNRRRRVVLLASSYLDASENEHTDFIRGGKPGSRSLLRESRLWRDGSYPEFERAMNLLQLHDRRKHAWFTRLYVAQEKPADLAAHKLAAAVQGLTYVEKHMPENIYVPQEISENGGFLPGEAVGARRPRSKAA